MTTERGAKGPARRPLHVAVMTGAAAGIYAASLAGVTALQASTDAGLAAEQQPVAAAIAEQRALHDGLDTALAQLKPRFGLAMCDSTVETLRVVNDSGGAGFVAALRQQAKSIRDDSALFQQIAAKQGWVRGTAKVAVAAPWLIVILLATRNENAQAYSSVQGSLLLLAGLVASMLAIRLISLIGAIDEQRRVLA